jgi:hypothetical protein
MKSRKPTDAEPTSPSEPRPLSQRTHHSLRELLTTYEPRTPAEAHAMLSDSLIRASSLARVSEEYAWAMDNNDAHEGLRETLGLLADLLDLSLAMTEAWELEQEVQP